MKYLLLFLFVAVGCSGDDSVKKEVQLCNCSLLNQSNQFIVSEGEAMPPANWITQSLTNYGTDCAKDGKQLYYISTSEHYGPYNSTRTMYSQFRHIVKCENQ